MKNLKLSKFLVLAVLLPFVNYAQSEKDTQDWIVSKLTSHIYSNGLHNYTFDLSKKGYFEYTQPIYGTNFKHSIPLNKINQVIINSFNAYDREGYTIKFRCKNRDECVTVTNDNIKVSGARIEFLPASELFFDKSLGQDNLPNRLKKAFTHLIKLNGGQTIDDVF
jgi:hypothetical protein